MLVPPLEVRIVHGRLIVVDALVQRLVVRFVLIAGPLVPLPLNLRCMLLGVHALMQGFDLAQIRRLELSNDDLLRLEVAICAEKDALVLLMKQAQRPLNLQSQHFPHTVPFFGQGEEAFSCLGHLMLEILEQAAKVGLLKLVLLVSASLMMCAVLIYLEELSEQLLLRAGGLRRRML